MRKATLVLAVAGFAGLVTISTTQAQAAPALNPKASEPAVVVQPVWYDRWGRWHPPYRRYGYGLPPGYYAYGPGPYWRHPYWRHRRRECFRYGYC